MWLQGDGCILTYLNLIGKWANFSQIFHQKNLFFKLSQWFSPPSLPNLARIYSTLQNSEKNWAKSAFRCCCHCSLIYFTDSKMNTERSAMRNSNLIKLTWEDAHTQCPTYRNRGKHFFSAIKRPFSSEAEDAINSSEIAFEFFCGI